jgi:hypothetical protein
LRYFVAGFFFSRGRILQEHTTGLPEGLDERSSDIWIGKVIFGYNHGNLVDVELAESFD